MTSWSQQFVNWIGTGRRHSYYQSSKMQNNFQGLTFAYLPHSYLQAAGSVLSATRGQKAGVLFHVSDLLVRDCSASSFRPKKRAAESLGGRDSDYDGWMIEDAPTFPSMFL
eukprot:CAMPEP_0172593414 /NCGR_PEP_ID=MMETSP1068-20121228/12618_1 /TAXON_ID=35684 /ORGANISM="Pseudopedinella elastica, Strain CCMP716" /LENGTH=110 /DNA_ID=CAMNT_0013390927 /DNA_START=391 /DNA_END=720 /DNA_ORIENTATION=+